MIIYNVVRVLNMSASHLGYMCDMRGVPSWHRWNICTACAGHVLGVVLGIYWTSLWNAVDIALDTFGIISDRVGTKAQRTPIKNIQAAKPEQGVRLHTVHVAAH